ncbi:MAG: Gram-negative porin, partial [Pseudomonadota bacterium]
MRKTQVALAAMALVASTAVLADGVTVYGTLDTSVTKTSGSSNAFDGTGNWGTSLFGIKGSEDLGNGMTASFNLEGGLNAGS